MRKEEIKAKAESLAMRAICCHGVKNAKDVLYEAYKIVRDVTNEKKESEE
uniref:Uncharacterized protein n=1 Tax=viral metagenome TaxID=1070528 RepID=A0A6M3LF34_9ZZZZ